MDGSHWVCGFLTILSVQCCSKEDGLPKRGHAGKSRGMRKRLRMLLAAPQCGLVIDSYQQAGRQARLFSANPLSISHSRTNFLKFATKPPRPESVAVPPCGCYQEDTECAADLPQPCVLCSCNNQSSSCRGGGRARELWPVLHQQKPPCLVCAPDQIVRLT